MKKVDIIGLGVGNSSFFNNNTIMSIDNADCLIGAGRMLREFSHMEKEKFESIDLEEIYHYIINSDYKNFGVLVSGDTGFYSLSKKLTEALSENADIKVANIPAISSLQYFCSKLNLSWDNIKLLSSHGKSTNIVSAVMFNKKVFMLTDHHSSPDKICETLCSKGLGHLKVSVGENLSYANERITEAAACEIAKMKFDQLNVIIIHNDDCLDADAGLRSIRDEEFITGRVPMTKSEVRTVSIGKLNLKSNSTVYDIGGGTGSVSVEIALKLHGGQVFSIERGKDAVSLIRENIKKFKAFNIQVVDAEAPGCIYDLPAPDCVFIGGSGGNMDGIINAVLKKNPRANIVINAIALQSLNEAVLCMEKYKLDNVEITNVAVSKAKKAGAYDLMTAQNPIYIISGRGSGVQ